MSPRARSGSNLRRRVAAGAGVSLRARVGLLTFAVVVLCVGLAVGVGYYLAQRELHQEVDQFLERRAGVVSDMLENPAGLGGRHGRGARPFIGASALADFDAHVQILDRDGRPVFAISNVRLPVADEDRRLADGGGESVHRTVRLDRQRYRILTEPLSGHGAVQIARDLGETDRALQDLLRRTIPLGVILAAAAAALAWLLARRVLRPVEQLTGAAERVTQTRELAGTIEVARGDEVGRLARSFNAMIEALQTSRRQQQRLVADAGHELRTPLTSMRTNIELLQRAESLEVAERRRILGDVEAELRELGELVRELVELAGEPGAADRARRRGDRDVTIAAESGRTIRGQRGSLERAVENLVGNAVKFSPAGTPIRIVTDGGRLEVHDGGPGIPPEDQELVFERFFRSAAARSEPGSGLGLAIVKQIVERHGGRVFAGASPGGGAAVGFEIPDSGTDNP